MEALMLDVKNYDAFRELVEGGMMSAKEGMLHSSPHLLDFLPYSPLLTAQIQRSGRSLSSTSLVGGRSPGLSERNSMRRLIMTPEWEFVQNLAYRSQLSPDEANFVRLIYLTKLKKVGLRWSWVIDQSGRPRS